jgi:hypothetical protein
MSSNEISTSSRRYYAAEWEPYGAMMDQAGKWYANAYSFPSRAAREGWVSQSPTSNVTERGYRFAITAAELRRRVYPENVLPYTGETCFLCGAHFDSLDALDAHHDARECF